MTSLHDRATGCLLGLACGDALGGAVEFRSRDDLDRSFPDGIREIMGGGPHRLAIGEYTDDTQMALAIGRACTADGIDLDVVAANFVTWFQSSLKDIGLATSRALALIASGVPWREAGEQLQAADRDGVAGNGSVMRCAPLALRFFMDPDQLRWSSIETSRMTHADSRATWGAVALNQGIAYLLAGGALVNVVNSATRDIAELRVVDAIQRAPDMERAHVRSGGYVLGYPERRFLVAPDHRFGGGCDRQGGRTWLGCRHHRSRHRSAGRGCLWRVQLARTMADGAARSGPHCHAGAQARRLGGGRRVTAGRQYSLLRNAVGSRVGPRQQFLEDQNIIWVGVIICELLQFCETLNEPNEDQSS